MSAGSGVEHVKDRLKMWFFHKQLAAKSRSRAIAAAVAKAERQAGGPLKKGQLREVLALHHDLRGVADRRPDRLRVAAVQMRLHLVTSAAAYAEEIYRLARRAAEQGAELVVFPEYSGVPFLGFLPGLAGLPEETTIDEAIAALSGPKKGREKGRGQETPIAAYFRAVAPGARPAYEAIFSEVARRLGIHIVTGSIIVPGNGQPKDQECTVNKAYFFGPDGRLLGTQYKMHLVPEEERWQLTPGGELNLFETPWCRVAIPVCMDATYFETFRIAALRGAEIIIVPSANPEPYVYGRANRGIWPRVQEVDVYGIGASVAGRFMGLTFSGRSAIIAPLEMTPKRDGFLARATSPDRPEIVVADLDLGALRRFRAENPLFFNQELYRRYLPRLYEEARRRRDEAVQAE